MRSRVKTANMARLWCLLSAVLIFLGPLSCNCGRSASNGSIFVRLDAGTPVAEAEEEKDIALSLLRSWALGDERKLFELAGVLITDSQAIILLRPIPGLDDYQVVVMHDPMSLEHFNLATANDWP